MFKATEDQTVVHAMVPLVFALIKGGWAVSAEFAHNATLRVGWFGQRRILCVPTLEAMEKLGKPNGCSFTPKCLYAWLKNCTVESAKDVGAD